MTGRAPLQELIDVIGDACFVVDGESRVAAANAPARELLGTDLVGRELDSLCPDEAGGDALVAEVLSCNGKARAFSAVTRRPDGTAFVGLFSAKRCTADLEGHAVLVVRESRDPLDRCELELELHSLLLDETSDGILAHTLDGEVIHANRAMSVQWGTDIEEVRARGPFGWVPPERRTEIPAVVARIMQEGSARFESRALRPDGLPVLTEVHARLVEGPDGPLIVSSSRDISERLQTEEMVRYLAYHDMLTGLANRVMLDQELHSAIAHARRYHGLLGVVFIDLDSFKPVNDTYGHALGDHVLREVADRISSAVRETDTVARLGGDEFVVVLTGMNAAGDLANHARDICELIARPIHVGRLEIVVTASAGIALYEPGDDADTLLTRADLGMYRAREREIDSCDLPRSPRDTHAAQD